MDNVLATLPAKVSPDAINAGASPALKSATISHASDLLKTFTADALDNTKVKVIAAIAITAGLTCEEFKAECKQAQKLADEADTLSGFKVPEDAKGVDKYGPTRRVLNQRLSEAKQLFGVFKMAPNILQEMGYVKALDTARKHLDSLGVKWDGSKPQTESQKALKEETAAFSKAMAECPRAEGEDKAAWLERVEAEAWATLEAQREESFNKGVEKVFASLTEKHGEHMPRAIAQMVVDKMTTEQLEGLQNYIQEELVIRMLETKV